MNAALKPHVYISRFKFQFNVNLNENLQHYFLEKKIKGSALILRSFENELINVGPLSRDTPP